MRETKVNPLVHYIKFGIDEGRISHPAQAAKYEGYLEWVKKNDTLLEPDMHLIRSEINDLEKKPLISIILVVQDNQKKSIRASIGSVLSQIYTKWELLIFVEGGLERQISEILHEKPYHDHRIKFFFADEKAGYINLSNKALELISGEFFCQLHPSDKLRKHAVYLGVKTINEFYPHVDIIYSDEDRIDQKGERYDPFFKPDWNPDLFLSRNLLANFCLFRINLARHIGGYQDCGRGDPDWFFALRLTEVVPEPNIHHIPFICIHCSDNPQSNDKTSVTSSEPSGESHFETLKSYFDRFNKVGSIIRTNSPYWRVIYPVPDENPLVSIIIPTRNQYSLLKNCLKSIKQKTKYANYEILIVNNQSDDPDALNLFYELEQKKIAQILNFDNPFNYSAINNFAAHHARGDILLFLNDDIQVISPGWLEEMVGQAVRKEIGAVGAMLYFPEELIQHAGIILFPDNIAGHAFYRQARGSYGQNDRALFVQNYSAVTGACMALEKSKFREVGGFDEENLPIAYNDVDLCLKLRQAGYYNLWTPHAELYHVESVSRGQDTLPEKQTRFKQEGNFILNKWGDFITNDPAYNPNLETYPFFSLADPPRHNKPWGQKRNP